MPAIVEGIYIRTLTEHEGPASLGFMYSAVHRTQEWKQEHLFTNFSDLMQFVQETFQAGGNGGATDGETKTQ